jgi:hypothetical protein
MDAAPEKPSVAPRKYVVLHHAGVEETHYDFMFEPAEGAALVTFRLGEWPPSGGQEVRRLKDHRRLYLTFEGTIPGDRGYVLRVDEGMLRPGKDGVRWILRRNNGEPWLTLESLEGGEEGTWWLAPSAESPAQ